MSHDDLLKCIQDKDFWREFAPGLSISDAPATAMPKPRDRIRDKKLYIRLVNEGYLHVAGLGLTAPFEVMADVMERLRDSRKGRKPDQPLGSGTYEPDAYAGPNGGRGRGLHSHRDRRLYQKLGAEL